MRRIRKYRHWIAAVLLALYAFIACPVQLWHHHPGGENTRAEKKSARQFVIAKGNAPGDDCPICSHRYSTYSDDYHRIDIAPHTVYATILSHGKTALCQAFVFHYSNKGPPSFIA